MSNENRTVTVETEVSEQPADFKSIEEAKAELAKARDALKAANAEAAERRRKLKAFEDADAARQIDDQKRRDAELSEVDRLKKEVAAASERERVANAKAEERLLRAAVLGEATRLGFADPDDAWAFADRSKLTVDGESVKGVKEAVEAVLKAKPHLKASAQKTPPNVNATNAGPGDPLAGRTDELKKRFRIA